MPDSLPKFVFLLLIHLLLSPQISAGTYDPADPTAPYIICTGELPPNPVLYPPSTSASFYKTLTDLCAFSTDTLQKTVGCQCERAHFLESRRHTVTPAICLPTHADPLTWDIFATHCQMRCECTYRRSRRGVRSKTISVADMLVAEELVEKFGIERKWGSFTLEAARPRERVVEGPEPSTDGHEGGVAEGGRARGARAGLWGDIFVWDRAQGRKMDPRGDTDWHRLLS